MNLKQRIFGNKHNFLLEKFKGKPPTSTSMVSLSQLGWKEKCDYYDRIYERHPLAKSQILTVAGQLMAEGVFLEAVDDYDRANDAVDLCTTFNRDVGMDTLLYETAAATGKYGSCFWEKDMSTMQVRMVTQQALIEPAAQDEQGNITSWRQAYYGLTKTKWNEDELVHFAWNVGAYWPYGTSLLVGLDVDFEILEQLKKDIKEYAHKQAFPKDLWQVGDKDTPMTTDDVNAVRTVIKNWEPGDEFVANAPINHIAGGTGGTPMREAGIVLDFVKDELIDGLMVPPISKQYNATQASAKEMMPWAMANLIRPMQRLIARKIEEEVYKPLLESQGFSMKVCPSIRWESPDANANEDADYYVKLVNAQILSPKAAANELGYADEYAEWEVERQKQQQQMLQQAQVNSQSMQGQTQLFNKPFIKKQGPVYEVRLKDESVSNKPDS